MSPDEIKTDLTGWNAEKDDKKKIADGRLFVPCRICEAVLQRIRLTRIYCQHCKMAFCTGEHGLWRDVFVCVICVVKTEASKEWRDKYLELTR